MGALKVWNAATSAWEYTGGTGSTVQSVIKSADQSVTTSTVMVDAADLVVNVKAGESYQFIASLILMGSNFAGDAKFGWTHPGGTVVMAASGPNNAALTSGSAATGEYIGRRTVGSPSTATPFGTSTVPIGVILTGSYTCTADGVLQLQFAQNASDATATILGSGSTLRVEKTGVGGAQGPQGIPGPAGVSYTICTSTTRPASPSAGMAIYETDTGFFQVYDGSAWQRVGIAPAKQHRIRAQKPGGQAQASAGVITQVTFDTVLENTTGGTPVNTTTGDVTIQRTGKYLLQFNGNWAGAVANTSHAVFIQVNGQVVASTSSYFSSTANNYCNFNISKEVALVAGDVVGAYFGSTSAGGGVEGAGGTPTTTSIPVFDVFERV